MIKVPSARFPAFTVQYDPVLQDDFTSKVDANLTKIASGTTGHQLLEQLAEHKPKGREVIISMSPRNGARALLTDAQRAAMTRRGDVDERTTALRLAQRSPLGIKGEGTNALVEFNPDRSLELDEQGQPCGRSNSGERAYLTLAHELIHAKRILKGELTHGSKAHSHVDDVPGAAEEREEQRAVGLGKYQNATPSENSIRAEQGEKIRTTY